MKYTHYAPKAPLFLVLGSPTYLRSLAVEAANAGKRAGLLASKETFALAPASRPSSSSSEGKDGKVVEVVEVVCGSRADLLSVASHLYQGLRAFDDANVDVIYAETFDSEDMGAAVMNRLLKAAGGKVLKEEGSEVK